VNRTRGGSERISSSAVVRPICEITTVREYREDNDVEVVLLGSDSFDTLVRTHASYFELGDRHIDQMIGRELAELGLS